ncbi:hypothetical protein [Nonomuraea angiospora]|uniref:hypothetical protein n=1 Tax=Nonomuraea angiospora TaxID=46172 RepID=UPI0029B9FD44|nr:hypothetical protein [Nonomuraea angiospora]MDX3101357.1 hypothetical protein [Nonomuraea angiospora]
MEAIPARIRQATTLMLSPVPAGIALVLITLLAQAQSSLSLPYHENPQEISAAMWRSAASQSEKAFRDQLISLGIFTAVATVVFGALVWKVRRGTRRPTFLFAVAIGSTAAYVAMLWQVFVMEPSGILIVSDGEKDHIIRLELSGWYVPLRGVMVLAGAVAQIWGLILLTGRHGVEWWTAHQRRPAGAGSPPLWMSPLRQAALLMLLTPALLLAYAVANYPGAVVGLAIERGEPDSLPYLFLQDMEVHVAFFGITASPVVVAGVILWRRHARERLAAGLLAGPVGLPYALGLLDSAMHYSDTSYFHNYVGTGIITPWWHVPAVSATGLTILLLHLASLALLFRVPRTRVASPVAGSGGGAGTGPG